MLGRERYYVDQDRGHDYLLRCKDCQALVSFATIQQFKGACNKCGNKRFTEITLLQQQEMDDIASGVIDFPDRDKFLAEFKPVEVTEAAKGAPLPVPVA